MEDIQIFNSIGGTLILEDGPINFENTNYEPFDNNGDNEPCTHNCCRSCYHYFKCGSAYRYRYHKNKCRNC